MVALEKTRILQQFRVFLHNAHMSIYLMEFTRWWILGFGLKTGRYALRIKHFLSSHISKYSDILAKGFELIVDFSF